MDSTAPIRSRAADEGSTQITLWGVLLAVVVLFVCLFNGLDAFGLAGPDEPRYAAIARAMAQTGDWVTPRLWGTPWFEKPVLYYWAAGISMRVFGVNDFAARFPSALAALLAVLAITWTALRSYGAGAACYALLMLPTSVAMIGFSRAASPDMLFAALLTVALTVAIEMLQCSRPGRALQIAFGFFLGAAVLAKGPAAVILAGGATLLWAALSRQWRAPFLFLHPLVVTVFCVTSLPWYILCALRNPNFLRVFIWQHNFERYLTPVFEHRQPFWYFGVISLLAVFPWVAVLIATGGRLRKGGAWRNSPGLFVASWGLFPIFFFSLSQSKLPGYILPAIPPLILLASRRLVDLFEEKSNKKIVPMATTGAIFICVAVFSKGTVIRNGLTFDLNVSTTFTFLILMGIGGLLVFGLSIARRPKPAFLASTILMTTLVAFANLRILPVADSRVSARDAALAGFRQNPSAQNISLSNLNRNWQYGLNYYYGRELPEWTPGAPLPEWLFTSENNAIELKGFGDRIHEVSRVGAPFVVLIHVSPKNTGSWEQTH